MIVDQREGLRITDSFIKSMINDTSSALVLQEEPHIKKMQHLPLNMDQFPVPSITIK